MAQLDKFFEKMVELGASDLHLSSNVVPLFRQHGHMVQVPETEMLKPAQVLELLKEIIPKDKINEFNEKRDTDFAYELKGVGRFRANYFMDRNGPGAVFRYIASEIITAEQLNLSPAIIDMCKLSKGLVVVTGPTGSGKSTTLCAMIDYINRHRQEHIITIEDPIEFIHENKKCLINQREVYSHTKSFKSALRAALREDPDIVLIGELRDLETIEIAIETAETGHLVFGTLHTTTAHSTVERVIQQFPGDRQNQIRMMLSSSLKGVIAQTLLRKKDGNGRIAAMEVLVNTPAMASLIREGKTSQMISVMQTSAAQGMTILNNVLIDYLKQGLITEEEAIMKCIDKNDLTSRMPNSVANVL